MNNLRERSVMNRFQEFLNSVQNRNVYIRGTKERGIRIGAYLDTMHFAFKGYIDIDNSNWNKEIWDNHLCYPPSIVSKGDVVLIAVGNKHVCNDIKNELDIQGIKSYIITGDIVEVCNYKTNDEIFIKAYFQMFMGYPIDLENPKTLCEKLQWLKLYDRRPEYSGMVDKYEVKKYVADLIGKEHVIPSYGVWDSFDEIDFEHLPEQFMLKCTHDSGTFCIVKSKGLFDKDAAKKKFDDALKKNYFYSGYREWPYRDVKPRIIAEKYIDCLGKPDSIEYKMTCSYGKVCFVTICTGIAHDEFEKRTNDSFDVNFVHMPWYVNYKNSKKKLKKPKEWNELIRFSEKLSQNIPYVRVDCYVVDGQIYFGELTFYTWAGFMHFTPTEWDSKLGNIIELPERIKE